ncbi:forkhead-associated domain-containing protein [Phanerochaete sordida]|uniref:Forkhead-associated domain-containing protein n=1 Tax=Phanerochaete sordida TaxID=48140 RepID=A0A9P3G8A9_9APHY|nr:forkhead-associated domain-containing protein [Phanerochaete sordida]
MEQSGNHHYGNTGYPEGYYYGHPTPTSSPTSRKQGSQEEYGPSLYSNGEAIALTQEAEAKYMASQGFLPNDDNAHPASQGFDDGDGHGSDAPQDFCLGDDSSDDDEGPCVSGSPTVCGSPDSQSEASTSPEPSENNDDGDMDVEVDEMSVDEEEEEEGEEQELELELEDQDQDQDQDQEDQDQDQDQDWQDDTGYNSVPATQPSGYRTRPDARHGILWGYLQPLNRDLKAMEFSRYKKKYTIGREADSVDLELKDPRISKRHCDITWNGREDQASRVTLRDHSSNGTWVNDVRLNKMSYISLRDGDMVAFADPSELEIESDAAQGGELHDNRYVFHHTANAMVYGSQAFDGR